MIRTDDDGQQSPLPRILQATGGLAVFMGLGYLLLRGLSLQELMLPAAALGLPIYLIVLVDPIIGIAILIACIGLSPEFTVAGLRNLRMEDFLMPGLLLGWILRAGSQRIPFANTRIWAPAMTSLTFMVLSTIAGVAAGTAPPAFAFMVLGKYAEYMLIYLLVINTVKSEGEIRALLIFSILVALLSSYASLSTTINTSAELVGGRVLGPLGETSNIYGGYLALHLLMALGLFLHFPTGGGRLLGGACVVLLGISILFTYSRTTYVAIGGAIFLFGAFKHRRLLVILLVLAAVIPIMAPDSVLNRMATVGGVAAGSAPSSWVSRLDAWDWAFHRMGPLDAIYGQGIGSVKFADVDSEYVRIYSDLGIIGVGLFVWLLFRIGRVALAAYDRVPQFTFPAGYLAGYLMAFAAIIIHSVAATTFSAIRTEEAFMVLTGLMTALINREESLGTFEAGRHAVLLRDVAVLEPLRRQHGV
jgi:hypothetical protein